jgi:hypothetical protein
MRKDEIVAKNISLVFDFLRFLTDHSEIVEKLPDQCELEFLEKDLPLVETDPSNQNTPKTYFKVEHAFTLAHDISPFPGRSGG